MPSMPYILLLIVRLTEECEKDGNKWIPTVLLTHTTQIKRKRKKYGSARALLLCSFTSSNQGKETDRVVKKSKEEERVSR